MGWAGASGHVRETLWGASSVLMFSNAGRSVQIPGFSLKCIPVQNSGSGVQIPECPSCVHGWSGENQHPPCARYWDPSMNQTEENLRSSPGGQTHQSRNRIAFRNTTKCSVSLQGEEWSFPGGKDIFMKFLPGIHCICDEQRKTKLSFNLGAGCWAGFSL